MVVPPCESAEACHGPAPVPPSEGSAASATFVGPDDPSKSTQKGRQRKARRTSTHKGSKDKAKRSRAKPTTRGGQADEPPGSRAGGNDDLRLGAVGTGERERRRSRLDAGDKPLPANFAPGQESEYALVATNIGEAPTDGGESEVKTTIPSSWTIAPTFNAQITDPNVTGARNAKSAKKTHVDLQIGER